jgi:hypothetical protein
MAPQPQPALPPTGAPARLGLPSRPPNAVPNGGIALLSHTHGSNAGPDIILHLPAPARRDSLPVYGMGSLKFATPEELKGFWKLGKNAALHLTVSLFGELTAGEETALAGLMADWIMQSSAYHDPQVRQSQPSRAESIRTAEQYLVECAAGGRITRAVFWDGKLFAFAVFKPAQDVLRMLSPSSLQSDSVAAQFSSAFLSARRSLRCRRTRLPAQAGQLRLPSLSMRRVRIYSGAAAASARPTQRKATHGPRCSPYLATRRKPSRQRTNHGPLPSSLRFQLRNDVRQAGTLSAELWLS